MGKLRVSGFSLPQKCTRPIYGVLRSRTPYDGRKLSPNLIPAEKRNLPSGHP